MRKQRRNPLVSFLTLGVIMMAILSAPVAGIAHHQPGHEGGPGNGGGGGGGGTPAGWIEQFTRFSEFTNNGWAIEQTGSADQKFGIPGVGVSKSFEAVNVEFMEGGILGLRLNLWEDGNELVSEGALVYTKEKYGTGTYEWCMRMSSDDADPSPDPLDPRNPVSGSVSAGFIYANNSQTEIDFEQARAKDEFGEPHWWLYMANWFNRRLRFTAVQTTETELLGDPIYDSFKTYKFVWTKNKIDFFVDGVPLATHTVNVPKASAHTMLNHWGTDNPDGFGG